MLVLLRLVLPLLLQLVRENLLLLLHHIHRFLKVFELALLPSDCLEDGIQLLARVHCCRGQVQLIELPFDLVLEVLELHNRDLALLQVSLVLLLDVLELGSQGLHVVVHLLFEVIYCLQVVFVSLFFNLN